MANLKLQVLTASTGNRTDCWNTPKSFVEDVIQFFDGELDLDPCSNDKENPNVPAKQIFTEETNGLNHLWIADSVFMNHPYSESKLWIPYAASQYECGNSREMILLIKLDISTVWWRSICHYPWIGINRRLKFGDGKSAAPFQSAIVYLGNRLERFQEKFGKYGPLYQSISIKENESKNLQ